MLSRVAFSLKVHEDGDRPHWRTDNPAGYHWRWQAEFESLQEQGFAATAAEAWRAGAIMLEWLLSCSGDSDRKTPDEVLTIGLAREAAGTRQA